MTLLLKLSILIVLISFHVCDGKSERNPSEILNSKEAFKQNLAKIFKNQQRGHLAKGGKELVGKGAKGAASEKEENKKKKKENEYSYEYVSGSESESQRRQHKEKSTKLGVKGGARRRSGSGGRAVELKSLQGSENGESGLKETENRAESGQKHNKAVVGKLKDAPTKKAKESSAYESSEYYSSSSASRRSRRGDKEKYGGRRRRGGRTSDREGHKGKRSGGKAHGMRLNQWPIAEIGIPVEVQCPNCHENFKYPLQFVILPPETHTNKKHHRSSSSLEPPGVLLKKLGKHMMNTVTRARKPSAEHQKGAPGQPKGASNYLQEGHDLPVPEPPTNLKSTKDSENSTKAAGMSPSETQRKIKFDPKKLKDQFKPALGRLATALKKLPGKKDLLKKPTPTGSGGVKDEDEAVQGKAEKSLKKTTDGDELKDGGDKDKVESTEKENSGEQKGVNSGETIVEH